MNYSKCDICGTKLRGSFKAIKKNVQTDGGRIKVEKRTWVDNVGFVKKVPAYTDKDGFRHKKVKVLKCKRCHCSDGVKKYHRNELR